LGAATAGLLGAPSGPGPLVAASDLFVGAPRPPAYDPTFLLTASGWNDDQPFPVRGRRPRYEEPQPDDPAHRTFHAKRRGGFPVGVAVETPLRKSWVGDEARTVRVAAIGQPELFVGSDLPPARARLFLETANWLLRRDDSLPTADHPWSYPRVELEPRAEN